MGIVYFKDKFLEESECHISLHDRSFRFGDGLFETMLVAGGRIYDVGGHVERLKAGLKQYRFDMPDISNLALLCEEAVHRNALTQGFVRVLVSRGEDVGGGTYKIQNSKPYIIIYASEKPYPPYKEIRLWNSSYGTAFASPAKTSSALHYVLAMQEAADQGCDNALLVDRDGHICETASGNIFWVRGDTLFTPAETLCMVPGTMRRKVMQFWDGVCEKGRYTLGALFDADEIFMSNTGVIVAPVTRIEPLGITLAAGSHTRRLRELLDADIQRK